MTLLPPLSFSFLSRRLSKAALEEGQRDRVKADPHFVALMRRTQALLPICGPAELANIINAQGRLNHFPGEDFLEDLKRRAIEVRRRRGRTVTILVLKREASLGGEERVRYLALLKPRRRQSS